MIKLPTAKTVESLGQNTTYFEEVNVKTVSNVSKTKTKLSSFHDRVVLVYPPWGTFLFTKNMLLLLGFPFLVEEKLRRKDTGLES